ncbi:MFS transporter [Bryobacterales bacterium F-183]|nr:MFS transporter [Bryobacterales bacterium F-183]
MGLGFPAQFWVIIFSTFLGFTGIGAIVPLLGPHVKIDLGQSDRIVGLAIGIFSVVALASRLLAGPLTDRRGRKPALIVGLVFCSVAGVVYLLPVGVMAVFVARILQGMGEAFLFVAAAAWAVEVAPADRRSQALGFLGAGVWGGLSAGPAIGAMLGNFDAAAVMLVLMPIPAIAALWRLQETLRPHPDAGPKRLIPRAALLPGLTLGFVNIQYPAMAGFLTLHLADHGNTGGKAFSAYATVILTSRFFLGGLPDRIGPRITFYFGLACMALGLFLISLAPAPWLAITAGAITGLGFSLPWPSIASTVLNRARENERAASVGVLTACVDLFVGAGSFADGAIAHHFGYPMLYWVAIGGVGIAAILGYRVTARRSEPHAHIEPAEDPVADLA